MAGSLAFGFSTTSYSGNVVYEREKKLKYALNVMGCRVVPYWVGTFMFDYLMYLVVATLFICLGALFGLTVVTACVFEWIYVLAS
mmetsp:Transcript_145344/g.205741  ORF Transcript_145344/g.205741 Transcript_145344/m.205741 type:complete len:85 (-) Transcript_145344:134-388(-)